MYNQLQCIIYCLVHFVSCSIVMTFLDAEKAREHEMIGVEVCVRVKRREIFCLFLCTFKCHCSAENRNSKSLSDKYIIKVLIMT